MFSFNSIRRHDVMVRPKKTRSGKSKIAASRLEILVAQLVHKTAAKFQLYLCFLDSGKTSPPNQKKCCILGRLIVIFPVLTNLHELGFCMHI